MWCPQQWGPDAGLLRAIFCLSNHLGHLIIFIGPSWTATPLNKYNQVTALEALSLNKCNQVTALEALPVDKRRPVETLHPLVYRSPNYDHLQRF